jgi:rRNA maturation protein Rpf1
MEDFSDLVSQIFQNHYNFHSSIGVDFIKSDAGHISQVSSDYQGRVIYELLQNAFDRAETTIVVKVIESTLYVANDGKKFSFNAQHDYKMGGVDGEKFERCDFQSLCSISTSNKTANESIGNKGVGFKSVYALGRYANVHTKGIVNPKTNKQEAEVSFRLYDIFDDVAKIPSEFPQDIREKLSENIKAIQREFPKRGVPGYYFPLQLNVSTDDIFRKFDDSVVTIIEVPFESAEEVNKLFEEIKNIHFGFVGLKYKNSLNISFEAHNQKFEKSINAQDNTLFSTEINSEIIRNLASKAGIEIEHPIVAIKFKDTPNGQFYNYLPTKKESPFKYVDFHADFHTTVDRKDINFDGEKVGAYNRALLHACLELYYKVLESYLPDGERPDLKYVYIKEKYNYNILQFKWSYIEIDNPQTIYDKTHQLFKIQDYIDQYNDSNKEHYKQVCQLISGIAYKFFGNPARLEEHELFFNNVLKFINSFTDDYNKKYSRSDVFKYELFSLIKEKNAKIIPGIDFHKSDEIFFRKDGTRMIKLQETMSISITSFEIPDKIIRAYLEIKDYNEPNEILKHFKQCSYTGLVSVEGISESEQIDILKSCYQLFQAKQDRDYLSTHRYTKAFTVALRENNSVLNQANFNIATLFLKLKNGRYKPAQLCIKSELDDSFLCFCSPEDIDNWLHFIGVSTYNEYRFVDKTIYNTLNEGINYIPRLIKKQESSDIISGELIRNISIVNGRGVLNHPALVNDNNYSFLTNLNSNFVKPEFENLQIKKYAAFPKEYLEILKNRIDEHLKLKKVEIIRFYQNVFEVFAQSKNYLIIQNDLLSWVNTNDFFVLCNKLDFDLCIKQFSEKPILTYYLGRSEIFNEKKIVPSKGEISTSDKEIYTDLKSRLNERIYFILLNLSHSKNSELDYLSEDVNLTNLQSKFEHLHIYSCGTLQQELNYEQLGSDVSPKAYAFENNELYLSNIATKSQITQGICDYLFSNITITDQVELILFHKELNELNKEYDRVELEFILRKWKPDFQIKFTEFQNKLLEPYGRKVNEDESWYKYNKQHVNNFLIELDKASLLTAFERDIELLKMKYEGYFDTFQLEIDYTHINSDISIIQTFYDNNELSEDQKKIIGNLIERAKKRELGLEREIESIKNHYPEMFEILKNTKYQDSVNTSLKRLQEIEEIHKKYKLGILKEVSQEKLDTDNQLHNSIENKNKQIIYQGTQTPTEKNKELEITGASGEIEVLICLINEFINFPEQNQREGVEAIKNEMRKQTNDNSFDQYADECLKLIGNTELLSKALIPLFYVAKKYKYAHFDLIAYRNGKPTLIEVKTTNNLNNKNFFISISEVNTARKYTNYEIVRVTPISIIFMGNPIKELDKSILEIKTNGFRLKPRNYEFILN